MKNPILHCPCCLVTKSCLTLHDPMKCSMPGFLSITNSRSLLKLMSIQSVMPSSHLILCHPILLLLSVFPNDSVLNVRWPKYCSFSFNISPSNEYSGLISFRTDWPNQSKGLSGVFSNTTVQKHQFFGAQLSIWSTLTPINDDQKNHSFDQTDLCQQSDISAF